MELSGRFFPPRAARYYKATLRVGSGGTFAIYGEDGVELESSPAGSVKVSSRLGNIPRRFNLPTGALFECDDNETADAILAAHQSDTLPGFLHRLENSWRLALGAVVVAVVAGAGFILFGVPATAEFLALRTQQSVDGLLGRQALETLDGAFLEPTTLSEADQKRAQRYSRASRAGGKGDRTPIPSFTDRHPR
jgi:hypothetical protein